MQQLFLKNIFKSYGSKKQKIEVLKNIGLQITEGDFLAVMGPSGSGKSTVMNIIGLLDVPTSGSYKIDNEEVVSKSSKELAKLRSKKFGFIFQSFNLLPRTSALKNVEMPTTYTKLSSRERRDRSAQLLITVGLKDKMSNKPSELSGGEQQRVAIARALVNNPEIILADEPTGNLDSKTGKGIMEIFRKLNEQGKTIILVTHDFEVASFAKRIIKLKDGEMVNEDQN